MVSSLCMTVLEYSELQFLSVFGQRKNVFWDTCKNASYDVDLAVTRANSIVGLAVIRYDVIVNHGLESYQNGSDITVGKIGSVIRVTAQRKF
ncbi:hypothetical protein TIFTF001_016776 [Ficus carica]|uniref:Uncharacterized protein n=1 Tax=Ficus carica TaxID=3494 RepID=A0AA88APG0_FICCA|nr:hypothetical protein TIFTF001_016776 [Ficus carica]